jgi:hypothetical protein
MTRSMVLLQAMLLMLVCICSDSAQADTYRSGQFVFQLPPGLLEVKGEVASTIGIISETHSDFRRWDRQPCYRVVNPASNAYAVPLARLRQMLKQRIDLDLPECGSANQPGITYLLTSGDQDVLAVDTIRRFPGVTEPETTMLVRGELPELHCAWLLAHTIDGTITGGLVVMDAAHGAPTLDRCLYQLTVRGLGLSSPQFGLVDDIDVEAPPGSVRTSLESDLLSLFVLYHADVSPSDDRSDHPNEINRLLTDMYLQGSND